MRNGFLSSLAEMARENKDIVLITGDLGFGSFEPFEKEFPRQYFNAGIAEQSMAGIASGLAKAGKIVFVYSIGNFSTLRCLEQIRNDACYHGLNVNFVSLGGGFSYGQLGVSHHATEDIGILRTLPNVTVVAPSNDRDSALATKAIAQLEGVSYLRLEKSGFDIDHPVNDFELGFPKVFRQKDDCKLALISYGSIISECFSARNDGKLTTSFDVIDFHTLSNFDTLRVKALLSDYDDIVTIEEHQIIGGLGSLISEIVVDYSLNVKVKKLAINKELISLVGDQLYLRKYCHICSKDIMRLIYNINGMNDE